ELDEGALGRETLFDLDRHTLRFTPAHEGYRVENLPLEWDPGLGQKITESQVALHNFSDRKSTRLNSSHVSISYADFCLKKINKDFIGIRINRAKRSGMFIITSSVNSREMSGITTILHELTPLFTINVTMRDITCQNVCS